MKSLPFRVRPLDTNSRHNLMKRPEMDTSRTSLSLASEETLDPGDWSEVQALSHQILDDAVGYLRDVRSRPVWQDMPAKVKRSFSAPLPRLPEPLADVYRQVAEYVMPFPMGNVHPRFWAWYMGSSNFTGAPTTR